MEKGKAKAQKLLGLLRREPKVAANGEPAVTQSGAERKKQILQNLIQNLTELLFNGPAEMAERAEIYEQGIDLSQLYAVQLCFILRFWHDKSLHINVTYLVHGTSNHYFLIGGIVSK